MTEIAVAVITEPLLTEVVVTVMLVELLLTEFVVPVMPVVPDHVIIVMPDHLITLLPVSVLVDEINLLNVLSEHQSSVTGLTRMGSLISSQVNSRSTTSYLLCIMLVAKMIEDELNTVVQIEYLTWP